MSTSLSRSGSDADGTTNPALTHAAMDRLPYPMAEMSDDGRVIFVNNALVELLGYPNAPLLLGAPLSDVFAQPKTIAVFKEMMERDGIVDGFEIELFRYIGSVVWAVGVIHEVDGQDGPLWQVALIDITDRKMAGASVARSEDSYRTLFEHIPIGLWEVDFSALDGWFRGLRASGLTDLREYLGRFPDDVDRVLELVVVLNVNAAGRAHFRLAESDGLEVAALPLAHLDDGFVELLCAVWEADDRYETEVTSTGISGQQMTFTIRLALPGIDGRADLSRVIIAVEDITERVDAAQLLKQTMDDLTQSNDVAGRLFHRSPLALLSENFAAVYDWIDRARASGVVDIGEYLDRNPGALDEALADVEVLAANSAAVALFEADDTDDLLGPISPRLVAGSESYYSALIVAMADGRDQFQMEVPRRTMNGRPIEVSVSWVVSPGNDPIHSSPALVSFVDITDRVAAAKQLSELAESRAALIASFGHELRTPITAVVGFAHELRDNWAEISADLGKECIDSVVVHSIEVAGIIDDLLVSTQLDLGNVPIAPSSIDMLEEARATIEQFISVGGISIQLDGKEAMAWADPARTHQILRNLVSNAVRYGGPRINIEVSSQNGTTTATIRDDGDTLVQADVEQSFQRKGPIRHRPTQPASIGIGLHVSRELARAMGGDLTYRREEPWTVFTLRVPATHAAADAKRHREALRE